MSRGKFVSKERLVYSKEQMVKRLDVIIKQYQDRENEAERLENWGNMAYYEGQKSAIMKLKWEIEVYW